MDADVCSLCSSTDVDCGCEGERLDQDDSDMVWAGILRQYHVLRAVIYNPNQRSSLDEATLRYEIDRLLEAEVRYGSSN